MVLGGGGAGWFWGALGGTRGTARYGGYCGILLGVIRSNKGH